MTTPSFMDHPEDHFSDENEAMRRMLHTNECIRLGYLLLAEQAKVWRGLNAMFPDLSAGARDEFQLAMDEQRLEPVCNGGRVCSHTSLAPFRVRLLCYTFREERMPDRIDTKTRGRIEIISGYCCIKCGSSGSARTSMRREFLVCCAKGLAPLRCHLCRRRVYIRLPNLLRTKHK